MSTKYYIGTSGWKYKHWKYRFYPENIKQKDWFRYYCSNFDTVEINYSFYRWPTESVMEKWCAQAPKGFKYTLKAPRTITHIKRFKDPESYIDAFYGLTSILKEKIGCHLFQAPPSFECNEKNLDRIGNFLDHLDQRRKNVIEFRHRSWWDKKVYRMFEEKGAIFCIVSGLNMPEEIVTTGEIAYFRFHGEDYSTRYSKEEIAHYAQKMEDLGCRSICAYFNNDFNAYATQNAIELKRELNS